MRQAVVGRVSVSVTLSPAALAIAAVTGHAILLALSRRASVSAAALGCAAAFALRRHRRRVDTSPLHAAAVIVACVCVAREAFLATVAQRVVLVVAAVVAVACVDVAAVGVGDTPAARAAGALGELGVCLLVASATVTVASSIAAPHVAALWGVLYSRWKGAWDNAAIVIGLLAMMAPMPQRRRKRPAVANPAKLSPGRGSGRGQHRGWGGSGGGYGAGQDTDAGIGFGFGRLSHQTNGIGNGNGRGNGHGHGHGVTDSDVRGPFQRSSSAASWASSPALSSADPRLSPASSGAGGPSATPPPPRLVSEPGAPDDFDDFATDTEAGDDDRDGGPTSPAVVTACVLCMTVALVWWGRLELGSALGTALHVIAVLAMVGGAVVAAMSAVLAVGTAWRTSRCGGPRLLGRAAPPPRHHKRRAAAPEAPHGVVRTMCRPCTSTARAAVRCGKAAVKWSLCWVAASVAVVVASVLAATAAPVLFRRPGAATSLASLAAVLALDVTLASALLAAGWAARRPVYHSFSPWLSPPPPPRRRLQWVDTPVAASAVWLATGCGLLTVALCFDPSCVVALSCVVAMVALSG